MFDFVNKLKDKGRWRIFKLKLIDARLYFVSIFVGAADGGLLQCPTIIYCSFSSIFVTISLMPI